MIKRTTIYLDSKLHQALKLKAIQRAQTLSEIINEAIRLTLKEDAIDLQAIQDRVNEPAESYESVVKELKRDGLL